MTADTPQRVTLVTDAASSYVMGIMVYADGGSAALTGAVVRSA
jgi:hypothetical protein